MTLTTNRTIRIITLCVLYFAQGFPWGFMTTAMISFLSSKGLTVVQSGELLAMAILPWSFKLFWGPIIDSYTYAPMGKRRPWIIFSQIGMTVSLGLMIFAGDITNNISLLGKLFFLHNLFASLQDVSCDALAIDILEPNEQGKVNGFMWGSKVLGVGAGTIIMGTILVKAGLVFSVIIQLILMLIIIIFPILFVEKPGDKRFPWNKSINNDTLTMKNFENPIKTLQNLISSFSTIPTLSAAIFILFAAMNQGVHSGIMPIYYNQTLNWESDFYSQILGGPATMLELFGALLGGTLADKYGKRKIFFLGWGGFSLWCGIFGISTIFFVTIPYWFQMFWIIIAPALVAMGTVAMFALTMSLSWGKASATMFTSYMAFSNLSTVIGTRLIEPLTNNFSMGYIYLILMVIGLAPGFLLLKADPISILNKTDNL